MKVPKVLYHGTTMLRWSLIQKDGLLRSNMRKSFEAEDHYLKGYVFLTNDLDSAITYGLSKSLLDKTIPDDPEECMKLNPHYRDPIAIGVKTSDIRDRIEINDGINSPLVKQVPIKRTENSQSYKHKGDIKLENLFAYRYIPFTAFDSNSINHMMKYHEEKLQASQAIMKRLESRSTIKHPFSFCGGF